jgi:hypothetical protein
VRTIILTGFCLSLLFAFPVLAQPAVPVSLIPASGMEGPCDFLTGRIHFNCIPYYIGYLIRLLLGFAGGFFLFGIVLGGYKYMLGSVTASGSESGKKEIIGRIIGFVVIIFSYLLVDTIINALT